MKTSDKGIEFIKAREGCRLKPYKDIGGKWTLGVGHLIKENQLDQFQGGITEEQATDMLKYDLEEAEDAVNGSVKVTLKQHEFDALVSLVFNIGITAFKGSTLLETLNENAIAHQFLQWHYVDKKPVSGLLERREREAALFVKGVYS